MQVIDCSTETTESLIDLMYTSAPDSFRKVGCEEVALSDHGLIYGILVNSQQKQQQCFRSVRCLNKCDVEVLLADLNQAPWLVMESFDDIDSRWDY